MKRVEKSALVIAAHLLSIVSILAGVSTGAQAGALVAQESDSQTANCGGKDPERPPF